MAEPEIGIDQSDCTICVCILSAVSACLIADVYILSSAILFLKIRQMARGQQKLQSQQRNLKKQQEAKKGSAVDHKKAAQKGLIYQCVVCRSQMPDLKTYGQHFENKHPKSSKPPELLAESTNSSAS
ncbi:Zinc finger protein [Trichinella nativa]|uniref:Zinc finger protein n=3 Tax=Trichinella TaxID=6333 RepID=A0A0V1LR87_9BILA|nr:Zinc finger protein [Trichinella sp. T9]KRX77196.1 Zinc finger protein [Trichinella sp. T6]KRY21441.1 Zinc finger protein [Trichinella patagoniensis]KRZ61698.1 Zinc finger protein [Trichinella nativa]